MKKLILTSVIAGLLTSNLYAEGKKCKTPGPHIWGCVKEVKIDLNNEKFTIKRSGAKKITHLYESTFRGRVQPISLKDGIETIGEIELIKYLQKMQNDKSIILVDTRTPGWHARLTIPGSVNMPYSDFNSKEDTEANLEDLGAVKTKDGVWDFKNAKTILVFCNGYWCGQTPAMVLKSKYALTKIGYPLEKIKYYRGGMQAWTSLGLTVVGDEAK
jgi:rhodanese-related sulfurtransferase